MDSPKKVTLAIVTWDSASDLPACLASLRLQSHPDIELVVVDNASADGSAELVRRLWPQATILSNARNEGFSRAHNRAIRESSASYYLPLNPDVVLSRDYVSALVTALENEASAGMAGGKLLRPRGCEASAVIDSTGLFIDRRRRQYLRGHGQLDRGQYDQPGEVFGVDGAAPLFRRAMLEDICYEGEYFDESFFAHKEDVDVCWRARWRGWRALYVPSALAFHERSFRPGTRHRVSAETRVHAVKNRYLLLVKNESPEGWHRDWLAIGWYDFTVLTYLLIFEPRSLKALSRLRRHWKRARIWRIHIQTTSKVKPSALLEWFAPQPSACPPQSRTDPRPST